MSISFKCSCGQRLKVSESHANKVARCPKCKEKIRVPAVEVEASRNLPDAPDLLGSLLDEELPSAAQQASGNVLPPLNRSRSSGLSPTLLYGGLGAAAALVLLMVILSLLGGDEGADLASASQDPTGFASSGNVEQVSDISEEECRQVAIEFAAAMETDDVPVMFKLFDFDELFLRSTQNVNLAAARKEEFVRGLKSNRIAVMRGVRQAIKNSGTYRLLCVRKIDGHVRALVRLNSDEGLNYHDLVFHRDARREVRIADVDIFSAGERMSETIERLFVLAAAAEDRSLIQRLTGAKQGLAKHLNDFTTLTGQIHTNPDRALAAYERLPDDLRGEKIILLCGISAAARVDEKKYLDAVKRFRHEFPDDPATHLMAIDWHLVRQEYDQSLRAIDAVDAIVGGDPALMTLRANVHIGKGDYAAAQELAREGIQAEPTLEDPYWSLVTAALHQGNHAVVLEGLKLVDAQFDLDWEDLGDSELYSSFVKSPQHQQWLDYLNAR